MGGYAPESVTSPRRLLLLGGYAPESGAKRTSREAQNAVFSCFWVGICRNGRLFIQKNNGFKTGILGGHAPDYLLQQFYSLLDLK